MSSGSPPNYSDGVPVKISEKFRPPPRITVPQSVIQRLSQVDVSSRRQTYDFQLESNVLKHISEWKNVIDREKNDRQERIRTKDLARLKQIEEEQKVKLNEISYPNTDDLSSDEDEKQVEQPCRNVTEPTIAKPIPGHFSPLNNTFDTILTPTPIFAIKKGGLDANGQQIDNNIPKTTNHKTTFNYSEFENGMESNPFDNMELSAIDDINILAQVLNLNSPAAAATTIVKNDEEIVSKPETPYQQSTTVTTTTVNHNSQPISQTQEINSNNEYYRQYNNYYNYGTYTTPNNMVPTTSSNYSNLNENYINQRQEGVGYPQNNIPYDFFYNPNSQNVYAPSYGYNNYAYSNTFRPNNLANIPQNYGDQYGQQPPVVIVETKSKSKSVPDIVKKLDDEIKESEMRRIRNSSQSDSTVKEEVKGNASILPPTSQTEYSQLPQASQMLVKRIHNMGFPVERVAKIVKKLGPDDKKVIEHLIPLSELLDLGFEEDRISDALLKYNNNKDKALDYLIS